MQDFSLAFSRVSHASMTTNPELKAHVADLLARAYYNLHGSPLHQADALWASTLSTTCLQLMLTAQVQALTTRAQIQLFEHVIRISEEHLKESRRHAAMAANVFYLKETAMDAISVESSEATYHAVATTIFGGLSAAHTGRVEVLKPGTPVA